MQEKRNIDLSSPTGGQGASPTGGQGANAPNNNHNHAQPNNLVGVDY